MRRLLLLPLFVLACTAKEEAPPAVEEAMAPAGISADQVVGNWNGRTMAEASDSVLSEWALVWNADGSGTVTYTTANSPATPFTTVFAGDSIVGTSAPHADAATGATVTWTSVGRMNADGTMSGMVTVMDSTGAAVMRGRWSASRAAM
jgi:hypothetical protein